MALEEALSIPRVVGYTVLAEQPLCIAWTQHPRNATLLVSLPSQTLLGLTLDLTRLPEGKCGMAVVSRQPSH